MHCASPKWNPAAVELRKPRSSLCDHSAMSDPQSPNPSPAASKAESKTKPESKPSTAGEVARRKFSEALLDLETAPADQRLKSLVKVVNVLRPSDARQLGQTIQNLRALTLMIEAEDGYRRSLREAILWLLAHKQPVRLLSDSGILANEGFVSGLWRRLTHRLLPEEKDPEQLKDVLNLLFFRKTDHEWLVAIPNENWVAFLDALEFDAAESETADQTMHLRTLDALQVISYRIAAIGLEPELVRNHPSIERYESPFLSQSAELRQFIHERRDAAGEKREPEGDDKHLLVLLDQCDEVTDTVRRKVEKNGASVSLTALLVRLEQNIERMRVLLRLLEPRPAHERNVERVRLFNILVHAENKRFSVREHWSQHLELLSQRITSNAGRAGEQYITSNRSEYFSLFRSAAGAGLLVAIMAAVKLWLSKEHHAPIVEAFEYSLNYVIGFVLMYMFHFTLATKQPAMTANRIAHSMDTDTKGKRSLGGLADLIVRTIRSQFIAVVGNISVAVPLSIVIALVIISQTGAPNIDVVKAEHVLEEADPLRLRTWLWGALTGVWLFVSGLVSGYYDNKAVYSRIPQRIKQLRWLKKVLGVRRSIRVADYLEQHMGGLAGSIVFGLLLGSTAALGKILGLPLDTLHVTFVSANTTFAWIALNLQPGPILASLVVGVLAIGTMNLLVSFGLAMVVALKSQQIEFSDSGELLGMLWHRMRARPQDFFWPPADAPRKEEADDGEMDREKKIAKTNHASESATKTSLP